MEEAEPGTRTFSQVVFTDIPQSYAPSTPITCCYTLTAALRPNARDWVGIFKVGWSTAKDYHTFVWVEDVEGQECATRQAFFKEYYLPKDELDFYQFCYVDSTGHVRGASTPFSFKKPGEQSLESRPDDDPLVVTTQEQMERSQREKADLQRATERLREENEALKHQLQDERREAAGWKGQKDQKETELAQLIAEVNQIKAENENLKVALEQRVKETDGLKEEAQTEMQQRAAAELKKQSSEAENEGRYERAVKKIHQLKEQRETLRGRLDAECLEVSTLNSKLREQERELLKTKDSVELLQVDLRSSEREKEKLCVELQKLQSLSTSMDDVKRENRELSRRLSEQDAHKPPVDVQDDDLRVKCEALTRQLQDAQAALAVESGEHKNMTRRAEALTEQLLQVKEQHGKALSSHDQEQRWRSKVEMQLAEAHEVINDKDATMEEMERRMMLLRQEIEELAAANQSLLSDMEALRRRHDQHEAAAAAASAPVQPDSTSPGHDVQQQLQDTPELLDFPSFEELTLVEQEEETLTCRYCPMRFPVSIPKWVVGEHERSHQVCPYCEMNCDDMELNTYQDHIHSHMLSEED